ncbi:MAG: hypothetical protein AAF547_05875 [Actinomycetota bacterium]
MAPRSIPLRARPVVVATALMVTLVGCSTDEPFDTAQPGLADEPAAPAVSTDTSTTDDPADADPPASVGDDSTAITEPSAPAADPAEETTTTAPVEDLAGEPFDGFVEAGDVLSVMGVAHDDVLNIREGPGTDRAIVAVVDPMAEDLVATGRARLLPASLWYEVELDGATGWAGAGFLAFQGVVDDATAEYRAGTDPVESGDTVVDLGAAVAAGFASDEPPSRVVQVTEPTSGDLDEVIYDVVGLGDDAVGGFRLHVFADPVDGDRVALRSIERTTFCTRGLTGELCS